MCGELGVVTDTVYSFAGKESVSSSGDEETPSGLASEELAQSGVLMCNLCQEQFIEVCDYLQHKSTCRVKPSSASDAEDMVVSEVEEDDEDSPAKQLEQARRHRQDAANNNSVEEDFVTEGDTPQQEFAFPAAAAGHVTLEALQNTKVAVAQFAATAMANNADNEAALQELAVLQSTLYTLQHQQVFQLQLINQLQQQLSLNRVKVETSASPPPDSEKNISPSASPPPTQMPLPPKEPGTPPLTLPPLPMKHLDPNIPKSEPPQEISTPSSLPLSISQPPMCSISSSLASTIITHNNEPPSLDEPNTLEMLQKRAQEVLDNASQGLLANNLADELAFRRKDSLNSFEKGRNEPFFKHRCRYCGKVFGSDSALQIHIRSHTGERPYKCNVCGSRFTTKGNLKVHFQRHSAKFPHIKMNPNPVPEHLDKYHPPLLAQLGQQSALSPGGPPHHPPPHPFAGVSPFPPQSLTMFRPHGPPPDILSSRLQPTPHRPQEPALRLFPPHPLFMKREEQEVPENLSKPNKSPTSGALLPEIHTPTNEIKREDTDEPRLESQVTPKGEFGQEEPEQESERSPSPPAYDEECSLDSKFSNEDALDHESPVNENVQDEPENLSNKSNMVSVPLSISTGQRLPANFPFLQTASPPSSNSSGSQSSFPVNIDPAKDPAIYTNLLPRPGSNDNSWESLIEITKTSETSKLQQLVDNIENKLTDPNQCVICHRVLSCKSALQMHYRTHTGERPFKCKICGRAFTTKGNLKTHMGVHRAKPPMRVLHQCPVCHKKFTNALVLQQHIRLHTGEPTDLTPEQIQAAEIKDLPSPGDLTSLCNSMNPFLTHNIPLPGLSPVGSGGLLKPKYEDFDGKSEQDYLDDDDMEEDDASTSENQRFPTPMSSTEGNAVQTSSTPMFPTSSLNYSAEDLCSRTATSESPLQNGDKSPAQSGITSPGSSEIRCSPNQNTPPVQVRKGQPVVEEWAASCWVSS